MTIEDFEIVKERIDKILALTADLKVQDRQLIIESIFAQDNVDYEAHVRALEADPEAKATIDAALSAINQQLREKLR